MSKTIQRHALLAGSLFAAAAVFVLAPAHAAKAKALKVQKQSLKPTSVPGGGGSVQLKVKVTKPGSRIVQVRALAQPGSQPAGSTVTLSGKNGVYQGMVPIPSNLQTAQVNVGIYVYVTTSEGVEPGQLVALVGEGPDSSMPPPPPPK
jgi:hypothetical protein